MANLYLIVCCFVAIPISASKSPIGGHPLDTHIKSKPHTVEDGFTLMEMLIVVTIIGILAAIILPRFLTSSDSAKRAAHRATRQTVNSQSDKFYFNHTSYPTAMTNSGWSKSPDTFSSYFPDGVPTACNFGSGWVFKVDGRIDPSGHAAHE